MPVTNIKNRFLSALERLSRTEWKAWRNDGDQKHLDVGCFVGRWKVSSHQKHRWLQWTWKLGNPLLWKSVMYFLCWCIKIVPSSSASTKGWHSLMSSSKTTRKICRRPISCKPGQSNIVMERVRCESKRFHPKDVHPSLQNVKLSSRTTVVGQTICLSSGLRTKDWDF